VLGIIVCIWNSIEIICLLEFSLIGNELELLVLDYKEKLRYIFV